jgi:thiol-disulfide isomerase/thioredoxin
MRRVTAVMLVAATIATLAGVYAGITAGVKRIPETAPGPDAVARLFAMRMDDAAGKTQEFAQWRGKPLVVNFWATWCEPCRDEMPALARLHQRFSPNGVNFVGIALDTSANVSDFAKIYKISYPLLVAGTEGIELSQDLGNFHSALPFTVILGSDGKALSTRLGRISEHELESVLQGLVQP